MFREDELSKQELAHWLALNRVPGLGLASCNKLLDDFGTPAAIFQADRAEMERYGLQPASVEYIRNTPWSLVESDLKWLEKPGSHILTLNDPEYPQLLREISDPPLLLFIRGDPVVLSTLQVAIVGSRKATPDGRRIARDFARQLAGLGLTVTSGLALGIDTQCHMGALDGGGKTVAVLGCGPDLVYPEKNRDLAESVVTNGALITEFHPGTPPLPANFPRRNRVISGLSLGTVVIEAGLRSGSLITARLASEQGREVFAVPGSIRNPLSRGSHALIRQGAKLVESVNDILEELGALVNLVTRDLENRENRHISVKGLDESSKLLLDNIGRDPVSIDDLVDASNMSASEISGLLLQMELQGYIETLPGGEFKRK